MVSQKDKKLIIRRLKQAEWDYLDYPEGEAKIKMLWREGGCRFMASLFLTHEEIEAIAKEMKIKVDEYLEELAQNV